MTKIVPSAVVLAGILRSRDPFYSPYSHNHLAVVHIWDRLFGVSPVGVEQQPSWSNVLKRHDHGMQDISGPWRVGDDVVGSVYVSPFQLKGVLFWVGCARA